MEKRDHQVFGDVFHAVVDKAQMMAGRTKKLFKNPLRVIDASVIFSQSDLVSLNKYVSRIGNVLRKGKRYSKTAVLYPEYAMWASFTPTGKAGNQPVSANILSHVRKTGDGFVIFLCNMGCALYRAQLEIKGNWQGEKGNPLTPAVEPAAFRFEGSSSRVDVALKAYDSVFFLIKPV
jgi:hypothetical protein